MAWLTLAGLRRLAGGSVTGALLMVAGLALVLSMLAYAILHRAVEPPGGPASTPR